MCAGITENDMNDLPFEKRYQDVLQNIEFAITQMYRQHPQMTDWDTLAAVEALLRTYGAEKKGRQAPQPSKDFRSLTDFGSLRKGGHMPQRFTPLVAEEHYHLYNRGNNRLPVFFQRTNYLFFLRRLRKYLVGETQTSEVSETSEVSTCVTQVLPSGFPERPIP